MFTVFPIPAFDNNYIWVLTSGDATYVVDPGDAQPVIDYLQSTGKQLLGILITHHHADHVGGVEALRQHDRGITVYGPVNSPFKDIDRVLMARDTINLAHASFKILQIPGHTLDHIAYYCCSESLLFCGDTLFSAGCGRIFEGSPQQMYDSLMQLKRLPKETAIYCAHEYTLANLNFAMTVEPGNDDVSAHLSFCRQLRNIGKPTLPSTLALELRINPFLRATSAQEFMQRRSRKDNF